MPKPTKHPRSHVMAFRDASFWTHGERARRMRVEVACHCGHCNTPSGVTHWLTASNPDGDGFNLPIYGRVYAEHAARSLGVAITGENDDA
jgi:hypothetical protein